MNDHTSAFAEILRRAVTQAVAAGRAETYPAPVEHVVAISGAAALGKTTFSEGLRAFLTEKGHSAVHVPLDGFMKERRYRRNFHLSGYDPNSTDFHALHTVLRGLLYEGEQVDIPLYDHRSGTICGAKKVHPSPVVILDGVISQHYEVREKYPSLRVFLEAESELVMRGLRLLVDMRERGYSVYKALGHADREVENYHRWIHHQKGLADLVLTVGEDWGPGRAGAG